MRKQIQNQVTGPGIYRKQIGGDNGSINMYIFSELNMYILRACMLYCFLHADEFILVIEIERCVFTFFISCLVDPSLD